MAKVITQDTFDSVVKENMDDFEMSPEDAVKDAVEQFEAQGVNLANIIKDPLVYAASENGDGPTKHPIIEAVDRLQAAISNSDASDPLSCIPHLQKLKEECSIDLAHRLMAGKNGAYVLLVTICKKHQNNEAVFSAAMDALLSLCNGQPDLLQEENAKMFCDFLQTFSKNPNILVKVVEFIKLTCLMHEANRQLYVSLGAIPALVDILDQNKGQSAVVKEVCVMLRVLTLDDDVRAPFGKGHEHAKKIVTEQGALKKILDICMDYKDDKTVVGELFVTLGRLAVRNEFCQEIMDLGGLNLMMSTLENNLDHQVVTKQVLLVLKAIAGNDEVKRAIMANQGAAYLLEAVNKHVKNAGIADIGCSCVATVCLRQPKHCKQMVDGGAPEIILRVLQLHPKSASVQRQACMAVRNIVSRNREHCKAFLDLGAEELLKAAMNQHKEAADEAKAALRDLECDVKLVEQWTGSGKNLEQ